MKGHIRTDTFFIKRYKLTIFRVVEPNTAIVLLISEQQAVQYVQKLHLRKLMIKKKYS